MNLLLSEPLSRAGAKFTGERIGGLHQVLWPSAHEVSQRALDDFETTPKRNIMTQQAVAKPTRSKDGTLLNLNEKSTYEFVQENGQKKYGPPPDWKGPPPPKGSEVFVGKLPRDLYEDEIAPVFGKIGPVYEMRLMMDMNGYNRGYAFVMYTNNEDAKKAIETLDNYEIRKGRFIGVCKSVDNCRLFVGGIPKTKTKEEILEEMRKVSEGVCDVILYSSITDKTKNRGFAFVEYTNHRAAAMARKKLIPGKIPLWGHEVAVDWAEPEPEVDEATMAKVTVLYVRNLMVSTTEERIKEVFSLEDTVKVEKVKKLRDFAFVHYKTREEAENALQRLNNSDIEGSTVEVTWAKPVDKSTRPKYRQGVNPLIPSYPQYLYAPFPLDPYGSPIPLAHCAGRGSFVPRPAFRGRTRGAAGLRRVRNYSPSFTGSQGPFKPQELPHSAHPPHYSQFQAGKQSKAPEEGKTYHQEYYMVVGDGIDYPFAVPAPTLGIHGGRIGAPYLAPAQAYEFPSYLEYPPPAPPLPPSSVAHY